MTKTSFILIVSLLVFCFSKGQTFAWAFNNSSSGGSYIYDIVTDAVGNTYAVGTFTGATTFGSTSITSFGSFDAFVSKRSPTGTVLWTVRVGGTSGDIAYGVSLDTAGNVIVVGEFGGTATFGTTTFNSNGGLDVFIMKVSGAGSIVWASRFGGTGSESARDVCVTKNNLISMIGQFSGTATFGSTNYPSNGGTDIFLARVSAIGGLLNSARFGGTSSEYGNSIAVDTSSRVVFTGYYAGSIPFGSTTLTSAGGNDIFVVSTSATFSVSWANSYGGVGNDRGSGIATDKGLNIFVTGSFSNSMTIGSTNLASAGVTDAFVTKLNIQGTPQWALKMGGNTFDDGRSVSVNDNGDIVCTGDFSNAVTFGNTQKISLGARDIYIVKFNQNGSYGWVTQAGGTNDDYGNAVSINDSNVFIGGEYEGGATFGNITLTTSTGLTGDREAYTAAMGLCPTAYVTLNVSACESYVLNNQTYTASGTYQQTLVTASGCDSIITLNLSIGGAGDANLKWANSVSATRSENRSAATDASGNLITTGWFEGTADFNPDAGVFNLTAVGDADIFITKLNASGGFIWAKSIGSVGTDKGLSITTDAAGNIYVAGTFFGTTDFNPGAGINNLTSAGDADLFVLKLDAAGNYQWAKQLGGTSVDVVSCIALDAAGYILLGGSFQGASDFDPSAGTATLTSAGNYDAFLAKLNTSGDLVWVKQAGSTGADLLYSLSLDVSGNVYATGQFDDTVDFDPGVGTSTLVTNGQLDVFIWKLKSNGDFNFVKQIGSTESDFGSRITAMHSGYIYITGTYRGTIDFDPGAGVYSSNVNTALGDIYVLKLDTAGNFVWVYRVGGAFSEFSTGIAVDAGGSVYVTGTFSGSNVDFNSGAGVAYLTGAGSSDIFLMKINQGGTFEWAKGFGSTFMDNSFDLLLSNNSTLYMVGSFWYTVDFDPGAGETLLTAASTSDAFVAKFGSCCVPTTATINPNVCGSYTSPSGQYLWIASGVYADTLTNSVGCDSIITINLTVRQKTTGTINQRICQGQSYFFNGANLTLQGAYLDTLVNAAGCDSILTLNLTVNQNPTAAISPATLAICNGASATLTASGGGTYAWSNSLGSNAAVSVSPTTATTYTVTVTDGNSCSVTASRLVTVNANPTASISPATVTICNGASATLTASGGGTYAWSNSLGSNAAVSVSPTTSTTYTLTVTDGNSCSATASRLVTVNANPTASISPATVAICNGASTTLTASGGGTYAWSNSLGSNDAVSVSPTTATTYTVTVTDGNSCSATASRLVTVNANPTASISPATVAICNGASATLTASGGGTYAWSNSLGSNASVSVSPTTATTYTVTVTGANACSATASSLVTVNQLPNAAINGPTTICSGLSATLTASGGTSYSWSNSLGTNAQVTVTPTSTTTYSVTVTNSNNCSATASQTVSVTTTPIASISGTSQICSGESTTLTANGGNTYQWANGLGTNTFITVSPTSTTTYTVTATIGANCSATASKTITVNQAAVSQFNQAICSGSGYTFNGILRTTSGSYRDTLQTINGCDSVVTLNLTVSAPLTGSFSQIICSGSSYTFNGVVRTASGTYLDTLQTISGCDSVVTLSLTVNAPLTGSFNQAICSGSSYSFNGQQLNQSGAYNDTIQSVNGCDSIVTLNLSVNTVLESFLRDSICSGDTYLFNGANLSQAGEYSDTVQTLGGCDSIVTLTLVVNALPQPTITKTIDTLTTQAFATYQWLKNDSVINGAVTQTLLLTTTGNYSVVVVDANGCSDTSVAFNVISVDVKDIASSFAVNLYPNPNTGTFTLEFSDDSTREIEITDAVGRVIVSSLKVEGKKQISLSETSAGIYLLNIKQNGQTKTMKFSLMR